MDNHFLERPDAKQVQLDFFYNYRTNVELYPKWQAFLKQQQPKTIIFWGQNDIFFTPAGGEAFLGALPEAEVHRLDSGHFALEDSLDKTAAKMLAFCLGQVRKKGWEGAWPCGLQSQSRGRGTWAVCVCRRR